MPKGADAGIVIWGEQANDINKAILIIFYGQLALRHIEIVSDLSVNGVGRRPLLSTPVTTTP